MTLFLRRRARMWKYKLPILFLILMSFTALAAPAKFGINFQVNRYARERF